MKINTDPKKIKEILERGVEEVIEKENLIKKLKSGKKLRIKFGIDPTANILHLGHSVCLLKLRELQDLGCRIIFLIGDFTARIGDPTGRTTKRVPLSTKEIKKNMRDYQKQASLILNMDKVEIRYNSEWLDKLALRQMMLLATRVTYSQISARADFKKRLREDKDFTLEEFMYPVLQGYDSVELKADVEIGGTDQKFNMLMGRRIQKRYGQKPQDIITCSLLEGLDGKEKMSKSLNNYIALSENPNKMYGKIMSIPDGLIKRYFELVTRLDEKEIEKILKEEPRVAKAKLAREIVTLYYNKKEAQGAEKEFNRIFKEKKLPTKIPEFKTKKEEVLILDLIFNSNLASSKSQAKRLILEKGVKINGKLITDWKEKIKLKNGMIISVGKRKFVKVLVQPST